MSRKDITDLMVCRAVQAYQDAVRAQHPGLIILGIGADKVPYPYEALALETGEPEKVCYRAMERADDRGLLECGVSLRTGWLTAEGKKLLDTSPKPM